MPLSWLYNGKKIYENFTFLYEFNNILFVFKSCLRYLHLFFDYEKFNDLINDVIESTEKFKLDAELEKELSDKYSRMSRYVIINVSDKKFAQANSNSNLICFQIVSNIFVRNQQSYMWLQYLPTDVFYSMVHALPNINTRNGVNVFHF